VRRILLIALSVIMALVVAIPVASGQTAPPANESQTLGELGAEWWTWVLEEPRNTNPLIGSYTGGTQCEGTTTFEGREVFFLAGTQDGTSVTRECTVSSETWFFFPIVNVFEGEPTGTGSEKTFRKNVNDFMNKALVGSTMFLTVDGEDVSIQKQRADTPLFTFNLPKNSIFKKAPAGEYEAVADGVWVLLPPLSEGTHTIEFGGTFPNAPGGGFSQDNTYILTVV
jgi:hypothetical protein